MPSSAISAVMTPSAVSIVTLAGGLGVFGDVGERLGDGEVDRGLDCGRDAFARHAYVDRQRRAGGQARQCRRESPVVERRGVDAVREVAQLGESLLELLVRLVDERRSGCAARPRRGALEANGGKHEALLRAIVQVPLEPATRLVGGGDEARG